MTTKKINNIVVIGGGTAGWLTALLCRAYQPKVNVTVIESEDIGILGAGEGTVPNFVEIMQQLKIPINDLVKNVKSTIKNGILFKNWNGKNEQYFHSFRNFDDFDLEELNLARNLSVNSLLLNLALNEKTEEINLSENISLKNKVSFKDNKFLNAYAIHFDARELAKYLRIISLERNINRVEGIVKDFNSSDDGITSIKLENDTEVFCDFIFDCSGFKRLVIGKHFASKWKSVNDVLPCDSAIPFFIENKGTQIEPYTEAIALKNGWVWKIPVQDRYGCGYVYDSKHTTEEDAKQEVRELFGNVNFPTKFNFNAGYFEEFWIKNCIAVGLSSGFLEPLEATSIWVTTHMVRFAMESFDQLQTQDQFVIDEYNRKFRQRFEDVVDFLRLHYITERDDSEFWKKCKTIQNSDKLNEILNISKKRVLHYNDFKDSHFELPSWLMVMNGLNLLDAKIAEKYIDANHLYLLYEKYMQLKEKILNASNDMLDHYKFIQSVKL
jgi:tryptophan halogenase